MCFSWASRADLDDIPRRRLNRVKPSFAYSGHLVSKGLHRSRRNRRRNQDYVPCLYRAAAPRAKETLDQVAVHLFAGKYGDAAQDAAFSGAEDFTLSTGFRGGTGPEDG